MMTATKIAANCQSLKLCFILLMLLVSLQQPSMVAGKEAAELLRRRATSLDGNNISNNKSMKSVDTWEIILVDSANEQSPKEGSGPAGSNLLTNLPNSALTSVIVEIPIISLNKLELSVTVIKETLIILSASNSTISLKASLTTPESNGAVVWEVQIKLNVQIQRSGTRVVSATGVVYHVSDSMKGPPIPLEQYDSSGQNKLLITGAGNVDLSSDCINGGPKADDCRIGASLLTFVGTFSTKFQLSAVFEHIEHP